jgi:hypothetical protein
MSLTAILALIAELLALWGQIMPKPLPVGNTGQGQANVLAPGQTANALPAQFANLGKKLAPTAPPEMHPHIGAAAAATYTAMMLSQV